MNINQININKLANMLCNKHTGFASGGVTYKIGALCFYSSLSRPEKSLQFNLLILLLVYSFVLRNPPEHKARKR